MPIAKVETFGIPAHEDFGPNDHHMEIVGHDKDGRELTVIKPGLGSDHQPRPDSWAAQRELAELRAMRDKVGTLATIEQEQAEREAALAARAAQLEAKEAALDKAKAAKLSGKSPKPE